MGRWRGVGGGFVGAGCQRAVDYGLSRADVALCMDFAYSKFLIITSGNLSSFMKAKFLLSIEKEVIL